MSSFSAIDMSQLPIPDVLLNPDFDTSFEEMKQRYLDLEPGAAESIHLESDPVHKILRVATYISVTDKHQFNDHAKRLLLAHSFGTSLDVLAANWGVQRLLISEANLDAIPPIDAVYESDHDLRRRTQLSLEGQSTAGPEGAYIFWAFTASGQIKDVAVASPTFLKPVLNQAMITGLPAGAIVITPNDDVGLTDPLPGDVAVTVLSRDGDGTPAQDILDAVEATLSHEDVRPLTDRPRVRGATVQNYAVEAELFFYPGPGRAEALALAQAATERYTTDHHAIGHDITKSGLYAALHQPGVQRVNLIQPSSTIVIGDAEAAYCTGISITDGGTDV